LDAKKSTDKIDKSRFISANLLALSDSLSPSFFMELPAQPVTLSVEQIAELNQKLANLRHDVNNNLSLIIAATEVLEHKPQLMERMRATVAEQPPKIAAAVAKFSAEFENLLGIKR